MFGLIGVVAFPNDRCLITALIQMAVKAVGADVKQAILKPTNINIVTRKGGVFDFAGRFNPVEAFGLLSPEAFRVVYRLLIHGLIFGFIGPGIGGEIVAHRIDVLLIAHKIASVRENALSKKL